MRVLALDVAFSNLGWAILNEGVLEDFGVISTKKSKDKRVKVSEDFERRCAEYIAQLQDIVNEWQPSEMYCEMPSGSQSAVAAKGLGAAVGMVVSFGITRGLLITSISQGDSKMAALGKRHAEKEESMEWARKAFPGANFPKAKCKFEHIADALMAWSGIKKVAG